MLGGVDIKMYESFQTLIIENDCMFANSRIICGDSHPIVSKKTKRIINFSEGIHIGKHVWVGNQAIILKNVIIPDDCIVATGAIVTRKFIEKNCVIGGNPAHIIKRGVTWDSGII